MKIIVTTDTHWGFSDKGDQANLAMLHNMKEEKADILIHCGDAGSSVRFDRIAFWKEARYTLGDKLPMFTVNGNHDYWEYPRSISSMAFSHVMDNENYKQPTTPKEVALKNLEILDEFNVIHLNDGSIEIEEGKRIIVLSGFDGWYYNDVPANEGKYIPGYYPTGIQWLQAKAHKDFEESIKVLNEAHIAGKITVLVTHFGFIEADAANDWKAKYFGLYFGADPKYEDFIDNVDVMLCGHSHNAFTGTAKNGTTKVLNVGSDYELPKYQILDV